MMFAVGLALLAPASGFGAQTGNAARRLAGGVAAVPSVPSDYVPLAEKKKILVLGGDGFCGWPTALHLSNAGHDAN